MQKINDKFAKIKNTPVFRWVWTNIKKGLDILNENTSSKMPLIIATIIFMVFQVIMNLKKSRGLSSVGDETFFQIFAWVPMIFAAGVNYLLFYSKSDLTLVNNRYIFKKRFTFIENIFTNIAIILTIGLIGISLAKIMWLFNGGLQTSKDLASILSFCSSPTSAKQMTYCKDCGDSVIIYNMNDGSLYPSNTTYNIKVVNRLNQAEYVACVKSNSRLKETCKYETGNTYDLNYETLKINMFSLATRKQKGNEGLLVANAPICPIVVITKNGVSDFPYLTKVDKNLIYQSIEKLLAK